MCSYNIKMTKLVIGPFLKWTIMIYIFFVDAYSRITVLYNNNMCLVFI